MPVSLRIIRTGMLIRKLIFTDMTFVYNLVVICFMSLVNYLCAQIKFELSSSVLKTFCGCLMELRSKN